MTAAILIMLAAGIWLRFHDLSKQFAQMDDMFPIAGPYLANQGRPKTVSVPYSGGRLTVTVDTRRIKTNPVMYAAYVSTATYAPLQFAFFPLVLHGDYDYRTFLLRGRLPSAICSAAALVAFVGFYRSLYAHLDLGALLGVTAFALSLMNITYAQQSISYAIGVLASTVLLSMIVWYTTNPPSTRRTLLWTTVAATLSWASYQIGVMVALAYGALALTELWKWRVPPPTIIGRYLRAGLVYAVLVAPLAIPLHDKTGGVGQFAGVGGFERFFPHAPATGVLERCLYSVRYAARAIYITIDIDLRFAVDDTRVTACMVLFTILFVLGLWTAIRDRSSSGMALAAFTCALIVLLGVLNLMGRFPLAPSRHALVFTPVIAWLVAVGANRGSAVANRFSHIGDAAIGLLICSMIVLFTMGYGRFRAERRDRFDEASMSALLSRHGVDTIVGYGSTWNPALMFRRSERSVSFIDLDAIIRKGPASAVEIPLRSFLLVSQHIPIEAYPSRYPIASPPLQWPHHRLTPLIRIDSDVEPSVSKAIKMGTNGMYVTLATYMGETAE